MKKTIVALAVAAVAATSANAATVYNQDGTKVDVKGSVRLLLQKATDKRTDLLDNGSRLEFGVSHDLGNGLSALGYARLNLTDEQFSDKKVALSKAYAGFGFDGVGQLTFGRQATNGDDLGVANYTYALGGVNKVVDEGDKVARFTSADFGGFKFGVDYVFSSSAKKEAVNDRAVVLSAFYDRKFGDVGVKFEAGLSNKKQDKKDSVKAYTVATEFSYGPVALGIDYTQAKFKAKEYETIGMFKLDPKVKPTNVKETALLVGVKYQVTDMVKVYGNYEIQKYKGTFGTVQHTAKLRELALGVGYQLHKNVETFFEGAKYQFTESDGDKFSASKVQVGLRVHF